MKIEFTNRCFIGIKRKTRLPGAPENTLSPGQSWDLSKLQWSWETQCISYYYSDPRLTQRIQQFTSNSEFSWPSKVDYSKMTLAKACFSSHLKRQMGISDNTGRYIPHYQANIYKEEWTHWRVPKRSLLDSILYCGLTSYVLGQEWWLVGPRM